MTALATRAIEALAALAKNDMTALGAAARAWLFEIAIERGQMKRLDAARARYEGARDGSLARARLDELESFIDVNRTGRLRAERRLIAELARAGEVLS